MLDDEWKKTKKRLIPKRKKKEEKKLFRRIERGIEGEN